ncbi:hypothetical protein SEA_MAGRITTE_53 [Microbacterium phage Magritte]|nr:hypothetical protein SEA_MAGRITTE_53 [Microbacterium phage Magritte]
MGYGVGFREGRWIGYMVPAECDMPDCHEKIDHGMAYLCEEHVEWLYKRDGEYVESTEDWDEEIEDENEGCGLYFCSEHRYKTAEHEKPEVQAKPDAPEWLWWILNEDSWEKYREENPEEIARYREQIKDFKPDDELLAELEAARAE